MPMFKALRISILLFILFMVAMGTWLTQLRSTDWNNSLWVKIYPINGDGSAASDNYIGGLSVAAFSGIEQFLAREVRRYGRDLERPVRIELGEPIPEQPPRIDDSGRVLGVAFWSLRMRWWVYGVASDQDHIDPDVRIFVRYHSPQRSLPLENSVGVQKGMFGIVNAYSSRRHGGRNNVVIAHEFLHTLGATDKYDPVTAMPLAPHGLAEPDRSPLYPQEKAELMGGRIPISDDDAVVPPDLGYVVIGPVTATEIRLAN
jgi:hypothetical protein